MADDEDPVVHEVDVFLSKSLADNLYLYQYSKQHVHQSREDVQYLKARVKPDFKKVELEVSLNTRANYDRNRGSDLAPGMKESGRGADNGPFRSTILDRHVYESVSGAEETGVYLACVFHNNQAHLTPVQALVHMEQTVNYMDKVNTKNKAKGKDDAEDGAEMREIGMQFQRFETDAAKARRIASYEHMSKELGSKPWVALTHHNIQDAYSRKEQQMLFAFPEDRVAPQQPVDTATFCSNILPSTTLAKETPGEDTPWRRSQQKLLPLQDQVKNFLLRVHVLQLRQLLALLQVQDSHTEAAVLRALPQLAVLVQGCWVIKSDLICPSDEKMKKKYAYSMSHLAQARDYIMYRLSKNESLSRDELVSALRLPNEVVKEILESLAKTDGHKWHFKFPQDSSFSSRYPDVVQRQTMLWENRYQFSCSQLGISRDGEKRKDLPSPSATPGDKPRRRRMSSKSKSRRRTLSGRSLSDGSDMEVDSIPTPQAMKSAAGNVEKSSNHSNHVAPPTFVTQPTTVPSNSAAYPSTAASAPTHSATVPGHVAVQPSTVPGHVAVQPSAVPGHVAAYPTTVPGHLAVHFAAGTTAAPVLPGSVPSTSPGQPTAAQAKHRQPAAQTQSAVQPTEVCDRIPNGTVDLENGSRAMEPQTMVAVEMREELLAFVREQLLQRNILSLRELRRLLDLELTKLPPNHPLGHGISSHLVEEAVLAVGGVKLENKWPPDQETMPLYANAGREEGTEKSRLALLGLFSTVCRIRLHNVRKKMEEVTNRTWSDDECRKLLKIYCVTKNGMYYLRGTIPES